MYLFEIPGRTFGRDDRLTRGGKRLEQFNSLPLLNIK